jgi:YVTN family beta-propeller protein
MAARRKHLTSASAFISVMALAACGESGQQSAEESAPEVMAPTNVAYVTNEEDGVSVIDLETLTVTKTFQVGGERPRGLGLTADGRYLLTANGKTNDMSAIDTTTGELIQRIPVGESPEFLRVLEDTAYVTYEPGGRRTEDVEERDFENEPPAEIAVVNLVGAVNLDSLSMEMSIPSGLETEGLEFSHDHTRIITTNEGDETISAYDLATGEEIKTVSTREHGRRPRGITALPDGSGYVVTMETSSTLVQLDNDLNVVRSIETKTGPNGVTFSPDGTHMLVSAARDGVLQVFDTETFELLKEAPIGRRCWHFTYTPDESKILVTCGRSHDVHVLDGQDYTPISTITGFSLPWGIVTYPATHGTLDIPRAHTKAN